MHVRVVIYPKFSNSYIFNNNIVVIMESNNEFEYTGKGCVVPKNVTQVYDFIRVLSRLDNMYLVIATN